MPALVLLAFVLHRYAHDRGILRKTGPSLALIDRCGAKAFSALRRCCRFIITEERFRNRLVELFSAHRFLLEVGALVPVQDVSIDERLIDKPEDAESVPPLSCFPVNCHRRSQLITLVTTCHVFVVDTCDHGCGHVFVR